MTQFARIAIAALTLSLGTPVQAQDSVPVPSGQLVVLNEVLIDDSPGETWLRFRFLAPQIAATGGDIDNETATTDMDHLCDHLVLPYLTKYALEPSRIVISLSDRDVPFGASAPDATQFFEAYRLENARCIWEGF